MRVFLHHEHAHGGDGQNRDLTLLNYLYEHNEHHAMELTDLAEQLKTSGKEVCAELICEAQKKFEEGNELLHKALHEYGE